MSQDAPEEPEARQTSQPAPRWEIETQEAGVWETQDHAGSEEEARMLASAICRRSLPDTRIRISTPDHRIL